MKEQRKFPAWMAAFAVCVIIVSVLPSGFLSFLIGVVGGGMIAINAGEQLRKDHVRKGSA